MNQYFLTLVIAILLSQDRCSSSEIPVEANLSHEEWRFCENFIKKRALVIFSKGIIYIPQAPDHPCAIEKDFATGLVYIHLKSRSCSFLGQGWFKTGVVVFRLQSMSANPCPQALTKAFWVDDNMLLYHQVD